jgi:hypothetical protein
MDAIGEVLSSSIVTFVAQSWQDHSNEVILNSEIPRFGSFIRAHAGEDDMNIYAVVYNVLTQVQDNIHKPAAMKLTRKQLRVEQPHIFSLLKTEIHAVIIGFEKEGEYFSRLAPLPPQVHDFVYLLNNEEINKATSSLEYLRMLKNISYVPTDELIAASLRHAAIAHKDSRDFLVSAGQYLSKIFKDDYDRLIALLKQIKPDNTYV